MGSSAWLPTSSSCRTFPPPLSVLLVEHDRTCLLILKRMLVLCNYSVTTCRDANESQSLIQSNKDAFDIALCEVHLPGTTGLELLDAVVHQTDIPVVMISSDLSDDVVRRAVEHGARDYLAKPVRMHSLEHLWRHLLGKEKWRSYIAKINGDTHELGKHKKVKEEIIETSRFPKGIIKIKEELIDGDVEEEPRRRGLAVSSTKKPRISWTPELHQKFVSAVNQLGTNASPKKIVQVMRVPDLTARHVASHLQKYRRNLKKATPPVAIIASSTPLAENSPVAAMMSRPAGLVQHQRHQSTPIIGLGSDGMDTFLMHQSLTCSPSIHTDVSVSFQAGMNILPFTYPNHPQAVSSQCNTRIGQVRDHAGFDQEKSIPLIDLDIDAIDDFLMHQSLVSNASGSFTLPSFGNNLDSGKRVEGGSFYQDIYQMNQGFAAQDYNFVPAQYVKAGVLTDTDTILGPYVGCGGEATMDTYNNSKALLLYQSSQVTTHDQKVGTSQSTVTNIYDDSDESIEDLLNMFWYN